VTETAGETIQSILCHEHPGWLKKALLSSKKRLLIISPWIRHQVVNWEFVASLEALLRQDVDVYIGYGLDDGDVGGKGGDAAKSKLPITPQAEKDLKQLADRHKNFRFVFVGNTHRKTLVSDDSFAVVTSFNWLSFKGDPRDKPRDEGGVVIRKKAYVDSEFATAVSLLENGYTGSSSPNRSVARRV
jgi:phosphatidylserine/phosphatidylglycerophosphate/cardiolipin synthase-like enzyme